MKMKISEKRTKQKTLGIANHIYNIIWFKMHLPGDVAVNIAVAVVLFFCAVDSFFLKEAQTKMKLKVSFKTSEHKNWGNADKR